MKEQAQMLLIVALMMTLGGCVVRSPKPAVISLRSTVPATAMEIVITESGKSIVRERIGTDSVALQEELPEDFMVCVQLSVEAMPGIFEYPNVCWPLSQLRDLSATAEKVTRIK